jgi:hypothetical protein
MTPPPLPQLTQKLLSQLQHEETLLFQARAALVAIHQALRTSNLPGVFRAQHDHQQLTQDLETAAQEREETAFTIAKQVGLPAKTFTLSQLAAVLPTQESTPLIAVRDRLQTVTREITELQKRNANILQTLRSYFRSVLSGLTGDDDSSGAVRYGPSGVRVDASAGSGFLARG